MSFFTSCFLHYYHHNPGCKEKPYSNLNYLKLTPKHSFTSSFYLFRADRKNIMSFLVRDTLTYDDQQFHVNIIRKMCCAYVDKPKLLVFSLALRDFSLAALFSLSSTNISKLHFTPEFWRKWKRKNHFVDSQLLHYYLFIYIYSYIFIYLFIYLPIFS